MAPSKTLNYTNVAVADESSISNKTLDRKYAYGPRGMPAVVIREKRRSERWSLLPAYTIEGFLPDPLITKGSINGDLFVSWLLYVVLRHMNRYPDDHSVLIIDNCSTHRIDEVRNACDLAGVRLLYLPPYSPDFNPIESAFHCVKQWMRRNRDFAPKFDDPEIDEKFNAFILAASEGQI